MKKLFFTCALLASSVMNAKIDLSINLNINGQTMVRNIENSSDSLNQTCEEGNLRVKVCATLKENEKITMDFSIYTRRFGTHFELISEPHLETDIGKPAKIELTEKAPKVRGAVMQFICNVFGIKQSMETKSALTLNVTANK